MSIENFNNSSNIKPLRSDATRSRFFPARIERPARRSDVLAITLSAFSRVAAAESGEMRVFEDIFLGEVGEAMLDGIALLVSIFLIRSGDAPDDDDTVDGLDAVVALVFLLILVLLRSDAGDTGERLDANEALVLFV